MLKNESILPGGSHSIQWMRPSMNQKGGHHVTTIKGETEKTTVPRV